MLPHGHFHDQGGGDTAEGANFVLFFDRAGDSAGGRATFERAGDSAGGRATFERAGDSTGGRAHGSTALWFFSFELLDVVSLPVVETQKSRRNVSGVDRRETGMFLRKENDVSVWVPGLFDPARCAHLPGNELKID